MAYVLFVIPLGFFLLVLQFMRDFLAGLRTRQGRWGGRLPRS